MSASPDWQGKIKPQIVQRLPLEDAHRAHEMLGEGGVAGKIVLLAERLAEQAPDHPGSGQIQLVGPNCSLNWKPSE